MSEVNDEIQSLNIEPKFVFGLTNGISGNCQFLNDDVIVYPASGVIVIYDMKNHRQKFIQLTGTRRVVTAMELNPTDEVLAVGLVAEEKTDEETIYEMDEESSSEKPIIAIFDLNSLSLKYVFIEPDDPSSIRYQRRFTIVRFLRYNTFLAAMAVNNDGLGCVMYSYSWRNSVVESFMRIDGSVVDMAPNPTNTTICCFVGKDLFKLMVKPQTSNWTHYGFNDSKGIDFTSVCWLNGDRCMAGTADGRVILFYNGELQAWYKVDEIHDMDTSIKLEDIHLSFVSSSEIKLQSVIRSCLVFQFGFVLLMGDSSMYYFQKKDKGHRYVKKNVFVKYEDPYLLLRETTSKLPLHYVESMCTSPNGQKLMCVTKRAQLYWASLSQLDEDNDDGRSFVRLNYELQMNEVALRMYQNL